MSNILTYPGIPIVAGGDMMIISDVSVEGNPTRTVSVNQLGAYIGAAGGGGAGVASINTLAGAINLVGGTNITLGTIANTITINAAVGVTNLTTGVGGDALLATVTNPTTTPNIAFGWQGNSTQYINGTGSLKLLSTIPTNITLAVTRTTGVATLTGNLLDIPNYGGVYTSYVQLLSQGLTDPPTGPVLENSAGLTAITWTRTSAGQYVGTFGVSAPADIDKTTIMVHSAFKSSGGTVSVSLAGVSATSFKLYVFDTSGTFYDSQLQKSTLEIRIYP
jgi:hypothetical protein